jgi:hypothetical protein
MRTLLPGGVLATLLLASLSAVPAGAERVALSPEEKAAEATHIVTGVVKAVYSRDVETTLYGRGTVETHCLVEIEVQKVEKGDRVQAGDLLYARCWRLKKRGEAGDRPGPSGHHIPAEGARVRASVARGKYPPTGQSDNGWAAVYPNGFEVLEKARK